MSLYSKLSPLSRFLPRQSSGSDLVLAFFVVVIIMMIIIPIPPIILDCLICINLMLAILLLMVSLYISKAVNLSAFPSILLMTTLFRIGIEISATRQILLNAYAGEVIHAFGEFVVGGDYVVGLVIFLIITIVQFIVVTKGAERVAEVAARFTLDAMPGKQMSIDADLRSGIIDATKARDLRLALTKESQLYGAMDGAMKFVKGDVIAGIVIAFINIVGGLIIGVVRHHMSFGVSASTYTLLSIGEGLVSQIPSLLISLTAGIVTTRVSSENKDANLGSDISSQILAQPKGIILGALVLFGMSLISAFPQAIFFTLSVITGGVGFLYFYREKRRTALAAASGKSAVMQTTPDGNALIRGDDTDYGLTLPVILEVGKGVAELIRKDKSGDRFIEQMIPKMRSALYYDLGVRFPGAHVRLDNPLISPMQYTILLNEVPISQGQILEDCVLTAESEDNLRRFNIPYTANRNAMNLPSSWVDKRYKPLMQKAHIKFWEPLEVLILHLSYFYKKHASEFLGIQEVRQILEFMEKSFPDLSKEVTRLLPLQKMTEIFRRLIQEQVSIKDLRSILEALVEWSQSEKDTVLLTEYVRSSLKRYISYKYSQGQSTLPVYLLDTEIEDMIRASIKQTSAGSYLALDPDSVQLILHAVRQTVLPTPAGAVPPVLLTAIDVRRFTRKLIENEFPDLPVVSYQEIVPEIKIQPLGRIQLG